jgi:hypothetical protein
MMNEDIESFERQLQAQPVKKIPAEWRAEILAAAKFIVVEKSRNDPNLITKTASWWRDLFWPHLKAWAGLAAVWILIFIFNFSTRDKMPVVAEKSAPPSQEVVAELKQQRLLFAELIGANDWHVADRQKIFAPKPRSEREAISTV